MFQRLTLFKRGLLAKLKRHKRSQVGKNSQANMEDQIKRFPCIAEKIFGYLDVKSLAKCREVCKLWKIFIHTSKFSWVRMIKETILKLEQPAHIHDQWNRLLRISNVKEVKLISYHLQAFLAYRSVGRLVICCL